MKLISYLDDHRVNRIAYVEGDKVFSLDFTGDMVTLIQDGSESLNIYVEQALKRPALSLQQVDLAAPSWRQPKLWLSAKIMPSMLLRPKALCLKSQSYLPNLPHRSLDQGQT